MAEPIIIEADIPDELQDAFREMLLEVPGQKNLGALVAFVFMRGAKAQAALGVPQRVAGAQEGGNSDA